MTSRMGPRLLGALGALLAIGVTLWLGYLAGQKLAGKPQEAADLQQQPSSELSTDPATLSPSSFPTDDPGLDATYAAEEAIEATMPRIQLADAAAKIGQPDVLFVDARSLEEFKTSHIKGAVSVPANEVDARLGELPKDKEIIFYCA